MKKELFFHGWEIYRQHWGIENTKKRAYRNGLNLLHTRLKQHEVWFKNRFRYRKIFSILKHDCECAKIHKKIMDIELCSDILLGLSNKYITCNKINDYFSINIFYWNIDHYPRKLDSKTIRNVYSIVAIMD